MAIPDLILPGPAPLIVERSYSSFAIDRDVGLGAGWSHSLALQIRIKRRKMQVLKRDGRLEKLPKFEPGQTAIVGNHFLARHRDHYTLQDELGLIRYLREVVPGSDVFASRAVGRADQRVEVTDARGLVTTFDYQDHRLTRSQNADGRIVHYPQGERASAHGGDAPGHLRVRA